MSALLYFGAEALVPAGTEMQAGPLKVLYEAGALRYIRLGETEIARMIYAAVRDENWGTPPPQIQQEQIETGPDWFRISYNATYAEGPINYTARINLEGDDEGTLTVRMEGEAQSNFKRNRIGLCVLHPLTDAGREIRVMRPDGSTYASQFPESIAPHQPFKSIREMTWSLADEVMVKLTFEGDIFETEDQRNWTDASFKTYGTPLHFPFPARVKRGDKLVQTVQIQLVGKVPEPKEAPEFIRFGWVEPLKDIPQLGMVLEATLVNPLPHLAYLEAELRIKGITWRTALKNTLARAERLGYPLALTVWFGENYRNEVDQFRDEVVPFRGQLKSVMLRMERYPMTPGELLREAESRWRKVLPEVQLGYGTTDHFAELNRNRPSADLNGVGEFIRFPADPQVHLTDTRTILENVAALRDALTTAQTFANGRSIHVGPIGLAARNRPQFTDPRQDSLVGLTWTVLAMGYLAGARAVTFQNSDPARFVLRLFEEFRPVQIRKGNTSRPLDVDGIELKDAAGRKLLLFSNHTAEWQIALLDTPNRPTRVHRISAEEWQIHRHDLSLDWLKPEQETLQNGLRLPAFSLTLIWID